MVQKLLAIQHRLNPLHLYCRFLDKGLGKRSSVHICKCYEVLIFVWIRWIIKALIYFRIVIDKTFRVQKYIGKR
ncbi:MAG: hypothetical protein E3J46_06410 [Desulfobacteraceae bacterium]|nr:MAG: hypothetical protein E3J46_06410 [Desulfobacteraceae bacterium]